MASLKAFAGVSEEKIDQSKGSKTVSEATRALLLTLDARVTAAMLEETMKIGDYNGMDIEEILKKLNDFCAKHPKEVLILIAFGVKNGGVINMENLEKFSGSDPIRGAITTLNLYIKPKGGKNNATKSSLTLARVLMLLHPLAIDFIYKMNLPAAANVPFPIVDSVFKSAFGAYMLLKEDDPTGLVYSCLLEWNIAHHDQVNPEKKDVTRNKFNKTIFDLKIKSSSVNLDKRKKWTQTTAKYFTDLVYVVGSTHTKSWTAAGYEVGKLTQAP
jgi:hypothetical protein